jgi:hypothetical protein
LLHGVHPDRVDTAFRRNDGILAITVDKLNQRVRHQFRQVRCPRLWVRERNEILDRTSNEGVGQCGRRFHIVFEAKHLEDI